MDLTLLVRRSDLPPPHQSLHETAGAELSLGTLSSDRHYILLRHTTHTACSKETPD